MEKKRELRPTHQRRLPRGKKYRYTTDELVADISDQTGFQKSDVKKVYQCMLKNMKEQIHQKRGFTLVGIGTIYPFIVPERIAMALNGGGQKDIKKIKVPTRWIIKFRPTKVARKTLDKMSITEEDLKLIYKD